MGWAWTAERDKQRSNRNSLVFMVVRFLNDETKMTMLPKKTKRKRF